MRPIPVLVVLTSLLMGVVVLGLANVLPLLLSIPLGLFISFWIFVVIVGGHFRGDFQR